MGPNGVGQALDMAIRHKEAAEEQSMGGGTEFGSPVKKSSAQFDTRFAGDALMGSLNGEFGRVANLGPNGEKPTDPELRKRQPLHAGVSQRNVWSWS